MNDERPIEKLLRRAAKKRGDEAGAPPELHPANRRMLQAEVARQFAPAVPAPAAAPAVTTFWALLTQRWVYAVGIFVFLGITAVVVLPLLQKPDPALHLAGIAPAEEMDVRLSPTPSSGAADAFQATTLKADSALEEATPLRLSGGGNFVPPEIASPRAAAPAVTRAMREVPERRESRDDATVMAGSLLASGNRPPLTFADNTPSAPEQFSRSRAAAVSEDRSQPHRNDGNTINNGGVALGGAATSRRVASAEVTADAKSLAQEKQEMAAPGAASVVSERAAIVGAIGAASDKDFLARGGGVEGERAAFNSRAFANRNAEQLTRKQAGPATLPPPPVLMNFQVQQQGRDVQVIDGDGSIYRGVVDEENTLYQQMVVRQNQKLTVANESKFKFQTPRTVAAPAPALTQAPDYYHYRVEGTNRSLNQNVVFTWNFVPTNEAVAAAQNNYREALQKTDATQLPSQFPDLLQNSLINGRAQFGEGKRIEVNAVPVQ